MSLFEVMEPRVSWLKAAIYGEEGSGKSELAIQLIARMRALRSDTRPLAIIDSEERANLKQGLINELTGKPALLLSTKDFHKMVLGVEELIKSKAACGIVVDQASHFWDALVQSYMDGVNKNLALQGKGPRQIDWLRDSMSIKKDPVRGWARFATAYAHADLDMAVIGRRADAWGQVWNDEKNKMERGTTGDKLRAEGDFGYESVLLIKMERQQEYTGHGRMDKIIHRAFVLKDTSRAMTAQTIDDPVGANFDDHLKTLVVGGPPVPMDTSMEPVPIQPDGDTDWQRKRIEKDTELAEIKSTLLKYYPAATGKDVAEKIRLTEAAFGVKSFEAVTRLDINSLKEGRTKLMAALGEISHGDVALNFDPSDNPLEPA